MEERIARVADSTLIPADLWPSVYGPAATRESRMEVVAWVAVCKFNCSLEGGFVRDWIVGNERARPSPEIHPSDWVKFEATKGTPVLVKTLVPSDLDCKMPLDRYFDMEEFCKEINAFELKPQIFRSRRSYRLLFDQYYPTGPFTLELIEPYSSVGFRIPDLDVNNLCVKRDRCHELIPRVDLSEPPCFINVGQIIENIKCKKFQVLPSLNELVMSRVRKMVIRGWTQIGGPLINKPQQIKPQLMVNRLAESSALYKTIEDQMQHIAGSTIVSIELVHNPELDSIYASMKSLITHVCPDHNPNERYLFHGIHTNKGKQMMEDGFDYGFFKTDGQFGQGAYFTDNAQKSHEYTLCTDDDTTRILFYNKVVLGREMIMNNVDGSLCCPPEKHHSVHSMVSDASEYIIYRLTQALPLAVISYRILSS